MGERVFITDVSARDGLQNEAARVPTPAKIELVRALLSCGFDGVECASFVSPKWIPQLADGEELLRAIAPAATTGVIALVPNEQGMRRALEVNRASMEAAGRSVVGTVAVFTAASESFARKNTNATIAETIERFKPVCALAREHGMGLRAYVSCAFSCPFEGPIEPGRVAEVARQLVAIGADEIDLGDTIGAARPELIGPLIDAVRPILPAARRGPTLTLHLHDTFGNAAACVREALRCGVRSFDGAVAGLGGCPYASTPQRRAPGNIDMGVLLDAIADAGHTTGADRSKVNAAAGIARRIIAEARGKGSGAP